MEIPLLILCIVVIILFAMILSYYINNYINQKNHKMHSNLAFQSIYVGDNKTLKNCPSGCIRGVCAKPSSNCKYDFQCYHCKDPLTGHYYLHNPDPEVSNIKNVKTLNQEIISQNEYIQQLNKRIQQKNQQIGY